MNINKTLIFHHIPKTAGTSLADIISRQFGFYDCYVISGDKKSAIGHYKLLSFKNKNKYRLIRGHQAIQLVDVVGSPTILTMFRDPVNRVISLYYYYQTNQKLYGTPLHKLTKKYDIESFFRLGIDKDWPEFSDGQYHSIRSIMKSTKLNGKGSYSLNELKHIIKKYFIYGIQERFDESILLFKRQLKWKNPIYYQKKNITRHKKENSKWLIEEIRERNPKDETLYQFAYNEFDIRVKTELSFEQQLKKFQKNNALYGKFYTKKYQVYNLLRKKIAYEFC